MKTPSNPAATAAREGVRLLSQWATPWDKRVPLEGWLAWARVVIYQARARPPCRAARARARAPRFNGDETARCPRAERRAPRVADDVGRGREPRRDESDIPEVRRKKSSRRPCV